MADTALSSVDHYVTRIMGEAGFSQYGSIEALKNFKRSRTTLPTDQRPSLLIKDTMEVVGAVPMDDEEKVMLAKAFYAWNFTMTRIYENCSVYNLSMSFQDSDYSDVDVAFWGFALLDLWSYPSIFPLSRLMNIPHPSTVKIAFPVFKMDLLSALKNTFVSQQSALTNLGLTIYHYKSWISRAQKVNPADTNSYGCKTRPTPDFLVALVRYWTDVVAATEAFTRSIDYSFGEKILVVGKTPVRDDDFWLQYWHACTAILLHSQLAVAIDPSDGTKIPSTEESAQIFCQLGYGITPSAAARIRPGGHFANKFYHFIDNAFDPSPIEMSEPDHASIII